MTITTKQHTNDNYCISMSYEDRLIIVEACPLIKTDSFECGYYCGYPIRKMIYGAHEEKKANNTFNRYIKKYI